MFYFPFEGRKYVVVHAIRKRESQETPTEDLNTAKQRMEDYIDRA